MLYKIISFDLDGTLIKVPAIAAILSFTDASKLVEFNRIEEMVSRGELGYEEALRRELGLLIGLPLDDIYRSLDNAPFLDGIEETIYGLKLRGVRVVLVSDNSDVICEYVKKRFGFDDFICTKTIIRENRIVGFKAPVLKKDIFFESYIKKFNISFRECIHVGDWLNDIPLFEKVGLSIGINPKNDLVEKKVDFVLKTNDLRDVLSILSEHLA